jgi:diacylglycerol kinase (ATP)
MRKRCRPRDCFAMSVMRIRSFRNSGFAVAATSERCNTRCDGENKMGKPCVILNPKAGSSGDLEALVAKLREILSAEIHVTAQAQDARRLAAEAIKSGCDFVVSAGGDGTLNEVVNGIADAGPTVRLGILPLGTGNDFARSLDLPTNLDECLEILRQGETRAVDLVRVNSDSTRYFVNVSSGGFSGIVDEKLTAEIKQTWGPLAYVRSAAAALPELKAYQTQIVLDDSETLSINLHNVIVANGKFVAGGIPVAPEALLDDGLLDLILIPELPGAELALIAAQLVIGAHLRNEALLFRRAAKIMVTSTPGMWFNVDGELVGNEPAVFEIIPRALRFVVGPHENKNC